MFLKLNSIYKTYKDSINVYEKLFHMPLNVMKSSEEYCEFMRAANPIVAWLVNLNDIYPSPYDDQ